MNNGNVKREELPKSSLASGLQNGNAGVLEQAKQAATHVAGEVTEQAKDKVNATLGAQKDKAVSSIAGVADAIREGGRSLREHETAVPAEYADRAADQIERIGSYIRGRTIGELVSDAESFARREPALFFGGAFALGLVAARFLKSSAVHEAPEATAQSRAPEGTPPKTHRPNGSTHKTNGGGAP